MYFRRIHLTSDVSLVYGFPFFGTSNFVLIVTLVERDDVTEFFGLLSRQSLKRKGFLKLFSYLINTVNTRYLAFIILEEHVPLYEQHLELCRNEKTTTFNGFPARYLCIDLNEYRIKKHEANDKCTERKDKN